MAEGNPYQQGVPQGFHSIRDLAYLSLEQRHLRKPENIKRTILDGHQGVQVTGREDNGGAAAAKGLKAENQKDHGLLAQISRSGEPAEPELQGGQAERGMGVGYYLYTHGRGMGIPYGRHGPVRPQGNRLVAEQHDEAGGYQHCRI